MTQEAGNGVVHSEPGELLTLSIGEERYSGMLKQGSRRFQVENGQGKQLDVLVRPMGEEEAPETEEDSSLAERFPHLRLGHRIFDRSRKRVYECVAPAADGAYLTLEAALFGNVGLSVLQRLMFSLSLAAAGCELKEYLGGESLSRLSLDAVLVEPDTCTVRLEVQQLLEEPDPEALRKLSFYGLLPPECYEEPEASPVTPEALRHLLAVLLFRILTAADPFDGKKTLVDYPYRTRGTRKKIYGYEAAFVYEAGGVNGTNAWIGKNVNFMLDRICPGLKQLFFLAFRDGIRTPERRPTAEQWLDNQKKMVCWMTSTEKGWLIPDLSTGNGASTALRYLCLENGVILPITQNRTVFQFMLDPACAPVREQAVGSVLIHKSGAELVFRDRTREPVRFQTAQVQIDGLKGTVEGEPWAGSDADGGVEER